MAFRSLVAPPGGQINYPMLKEYAVKTTAALSMQVISVWASIYFLS